MLQLANTQKTLVNAFMAAFGHNDTDHPAVQLVDMHLTNHPEILTYFKYAAAWILLNILTVLFVACVAIKLIAFLVYALIVVISRIYGALKKTLLRGGEDLKETVAATKGEKVKEKEGAGPDKKDVTASPPETMRPAHVGKEHDAAGTAASVPIQQ